MYVRNKRMAEKKFVISDLHAQIVTFYPILGQKSYAETKIFGKFREFWSGKSSLQEVLDIYHRQIKI